MSKIKIALGVEYDGSNYYGWQRQQAVPSIQEQLECALSKVADENIITFCAGRTDAGVHAFGQVVHFETNALRHMNAWIMGANTHLPTSIVVKWAKIVSDDFHARFSAIARSYLYLIYNNQIRPAIFKSGLLHYYQPLNVALMCQSAQYLVGEHDFSSFRAAQCQSNSPWRNITHITVRRIGEYIIVEIKANAFVYHMVRNIVGCLLEIGVGNKPKEWMNELLLLKDRTKAAATAKPSGLYLSTVDYPERFNLPVLINSLLTLRQI